METEALSCSLQSELAGPGESISPFQTNLPPTTHFPGGALAAITGTAQGQGSHTGPPGQEGVSAEAPGGGLACENPQVPPAFS